MNEDTFVETSDKVLELKKIGRHFGSDPVVNALTDINFSLDSGDWLSITGPSGSGKSTLLNILGCLDKPSNGSFCIDGIETTSLTDKQRTGLRSQRIGFVFQSFHLLSYRSVLENVMLGEVYRKQPLVGRRERALDALKRVGLSHRVNYLPMKLSGGERQRVAIARALVGSPSMLLCDEPTGNLDSKNTESILKLFKKLNAGGLTLVIVTHDPAVAAIASRKVKIVDGRMISLEQVSKKSINAISELKQVITKKETLKYLARKKNKKSRPKLKPNIAESGMTIRDLLNEALAGMFARPTRMILTVLGVVIGLTALVATLGLTRTASNRIISQFDQLAATELFVSARPGKATGIVNPRALPWDAAVRLKRLNGVVAVGTLSEVDSGDDLVSASAIKDVLNQSAFKLSIHAASPDLFRAVRAELKVGRLPDAGHSKRTDRVAVLGPDAAERLGINSLQQLPAILIGDHLYLVIGILSDVARKPELLGSVIIPEGTAQRYFGLLGPGTIVIETKVGAAYLIAKQAPLAVRPDKPRVLKVEVPKEPKRVKDEVQSDLNVMFLMLGGLSLVVGAIGIANITLVGVMERTAEIGLRRAIGATRGHIAAQFLFESGVIGIIGGIIGASLGVLIVILVSAYQVWTPVLDSAAPLLSPLVGGGIGILSGIYPAMRAARMEPVEAFRN
ncbi:Macrolide export ATP-binding/permease protein MacB [hydrothermal vent metagenome]|uniref:Macrolide export ATP-binding/permease protein MacB n=1 Tax=hydrothermal vent metagenome TaxID=652676 RepID=A0A3B1A944_9ZZZZ